MRVSAKEELKFAKGMMDRRENVRAGLRNATSKSEAVGNYRSLLRCLVEVRKHHNRIIKTVDNETAGYAHESSLLLDSARNWVSQARAIAMARGATLSEVNDIDRQMEDMTRGMR